MALAERLSKNFYRTKYIVEDRFSKGIQPFLYYYLKWQPQRFYDESYVLKSTKFFNGLLRDQLEYIKNNVDSFRVAITGIEGCGKSMLGLEIAHLVRDWDNKGGKVHIGYGAEGFCQLFEEGLVGENDVVVADEMRTKYEGEGSRKIEWRLENIKTVNRKRRIHYVFISTDIKQYFSTLAEFKICGKDPVRRETAFFLYLGNKLIGKCFLRIRDLEKYTAMEEQYKDLFIGRVEGSGGAVSVKISKREEEIIKDISFKFDNIREFIVDNAHDKINKIILKGVFEGEDQTTIAKSIGVSQFAVSKRLTHFGESQLGYIAEQYFMHKFGDKRSFLGRVPQAEPDVIGADGQVYSIKCYIGYKNTQIIYPTRDCTPELEYCRRNNIPYFTLIFVNPIWGDGYYHYDIYLKEPPNWVSFNKDGTYKIG